MPKYNFKCSECKNETLIFTIDKDNYEIPVCDSCNKPMKKGISKPKPIIKKQRDKVRGKNVKENVNEDLKKRSHEHFVEYEMPDLIEKYGRKTAERLGWVDKKTGKKKTKIDEK